MADPEIDRGVFAIDDSRLEWRRVSPRGGRRDHDRPTLVLLHEGLVATRVMRDAEREGRRWSLKRHNSRVLNGFGLPFVVDLGTKRLRFYFVGQRAVYRHVLWDLCSWNRHGAHEAHQPFTGTLELLLES